MTSFNTDSFLNATADPGRDPIRGHVALLYLGFEFFELNELLKDLPEQPQDKMDDDDAVADKDKKKQRWWPW